MLGDIAARLKAMVPALRDVKGIADYAALTGTPPAHLLPAAYVVLLDETAQPSATSPYVMQLVTVRMGIMLVVQGAQADATGGAAAQSLSGLRAAVRQALLGWRPAGAEGGLEYVSGDLMELAGGCLFWADTYQTDVTYRSDT